MASSATQSIVVWEWLNEIGHWRPYLPHVADFIESHYNAQSPSANLGNIESSLFMYSIDFATMCQIRIGTGTPRQVRRALYPLDSALGHGFLWQWEGDKPGEWHIYDVNVANIIEDFFSQQNRTSDLLDLSRTSVLAPYVINLGQMTQVRIDTGRQRHIKREKLTIQYPRTSASQNTQLNSVSRPPPSGYPHPKKLRLMSSISAPNSLQSSHPYLNPVPGASANNSSSTSNSSVSSFGNYIYAGISNYPIINSTSTSGTFTSTNSSSNLSMANTQVHSSGPLTRKRSLPSPSGPPAINNAHQGTLSTLSNMRSASMVAAPGMPLTGNVVSLHSSGLQGSSNNLHHGIPPGLTNHMLNVQSIMSGGLPVPGNLFSKSRGASRISPVVSSATNILASPAVPLLLSPTSGGAESDLPLEGRIPNNVPKSSKKQMAAGKSETEAIFKKYSTVLESPPEDDDCCICCEKMTHPSGYGEGKSEANIVLKLTKCSHVFHKLCILAMYESSSKNGCVQCPTCKTIYGEKHGNCPRGVLEYHRMPQPLPSYPPDCQTIRIMYHISPGNQGPEHPHPGKRYSTRGFPRIGYLPDNEKGRKALKLLIVAWKRRLTFTVGQSSTTGESDTVTWNEIHHKTEFGTNYTGHGFPDPNYLDNVLMELAVHGVTEDDL